MQAELDAIIDQLKRLRRQGVAAVPVSEETLLELERAVSRPKASGTAAGEAPKPTTAVDDRDAKARAANAGRRAGVKVYQSVPIPHPPRVALPDGSKQERWDWLRERVLNCPVCNAHVKPGKHIVFGVGSIDADLFFCGEAPGADEEIEAEPFVGRAGQLLTKVLKAMGLERSDVYISNIMNWRPEMPTPVGNRPPTYEEMQFCLPYLRAQLEVVKPKIIIAMGGTAVSGLIGPDPKRRMGSVRGKWLEFEGTPMMITYHPAYVVRSGSVYTKRLIWEDMLAVMDRVGLPVSDKQRSYFRK